MANRSKTSAAEPKTITPTLDKETPAKRGPKVHQMKDLSEFVETLNKLEPKERKANRTKTAEAMLDIFMVRMLDMLSSDKCRAQTLLVAASFFKKNEFIVEPDKAGVEDYLDKLARQKREAAADEQHRLKNIARAKEIEEKRVAAFYAKQNGEPLSPRLNQGEPGPIVPTDESEEATSE